MIINLIGVPINYGCDREGAQYGPKKLRDSGIFEVIKNKGHEVYDLGDIYVPTISSDDKYCHHNKMKYLNPVVDINTNLAQQVYCSLSGNSFPFIIGGDHSIGMGSIAGASKFHKELAVIWVDAHGDINNSETSPSGNIHGMPLAASMGIGHEILTDLYYKGQKVKPENVYIIGARDLDEGEVLLAEELKVNLYTMETIRDIGLGNVVKEVISKVKSSNIDAVHLSFDIDVLDSEIVPGTGTKVPEGFTKEEGKFILKEILEEGFVKSMDFVELNPVLDIDNKTAHLCVDLIDYIFDVIK